MPRHVIICHRRRPRSPIPDLAVTVPSENLRLQTEPHHRPKCLSYGIQLPTVRPGKEDEMQLLYCIDEEVSRDSAHNLPIFSKFPRPCVGVFSVRESMTRGSSHRSGLKGESCLPTAGSNVSACDDSKGRSSYMLFFNRGGLSNTRDVHSSFNTRNLLMLV